MWGLDPCFSSPNSNTPVFPPLSLTLLSFAWFYIFFSTGQVLLSTLSWCSACISEGVFLKYPWRETPRPPTPPPFRSLPVVCFCDTEMHEVFVYLGDQFLVSHFICKFLFFHFVGLSFCFVYCFLCCAKAFKFNKIRFVYACFYFHYSRKWIRKDIAVIYVREHSAYVLSKGFIVYSFKFRSLIHFAMTNLDSILKKRHHFTNKGLYSQRYGFSNSHVWMWELDHKEGLTLKNQCFWIMVLEKTLESLLDFKEIKPVNPKGKQPWIHIGNTDAEAEAPATWCEELTHQKRPWCWERLKAKGEVGGRGWDG